MKLVVVKVELEDKMEYPAPNPDPGEHIVVRVVELAQLKRVLEGAYTSVRPPSANDVCPRKEYDQKVRETLASSLRTLIS